MTRRPPLKELSVLLFCCLISIVSVLRSSSSIRCISTVGEVDQYYRNAHSTTDARKGDNNKEAVDKDENKEYSNESSMIHGEDNNENSNANDGGNDGNDNDDSEVVNVGKANMFKDDSDVTNAKNDDGNCPPNFVNMHDQILPQNVTHHDRMIPRTIHFIVRSKCIPEEIANNIHHWTSLANHSIIYHEQKDIDEYMSKERNDLPMVAPAYKCALDSHAKLDLARFLILWDVGGIVIDIDTVPGPAFLNGTIVAANDECLFEVDGKWTANPRFLACKPRHYALYAAIFRLVSVQHRSDYANSRSDIYMGFIAQSHYRIREVKPLKTYRMHRPEYPDSFFGQINTNRTDDDLFTQLVLSNKTKDGIKLISSDDAHQQCTAVLNNDSFQVDIDSLLELLGFTKQNITCPDDQILIDSKYHPGSVIEGRKIPKIVHMTSKSKCFTKAYADNINLWNFEDHSFFMHDDATVDRLLNREWPEFPLLQEARSCLSSGAGMADLWRYLILWEYGGIYSDIDNAPGSLFLNGTLIKDNTDSLLEVERGGFPSQYFLAGTFIQGSAF